MNVKTKEACMLEDVMKKCTPPTVYEIRGITRIL